MKCPSCGWVGDRKTLESISFYNCSMSIRTKEICPKCGQLILLTYGNGKICPGWRRVEVSE